MGRDLRFTDVLTSERGGWEVFFESAIAENAKQLGANAQLRETAQPIELLVSVEDLIASHTIHTQQHTLGGTNGNEEYSVCHGTADTVELDVLVVVDWSKERRNE